MMADYSLSCKWCRSGIEDHADMERHMKDVHGIKNRKLKKGDYGYPLYKTDMEREIADNIVYDYESYSKAKEYDPTGEPDIMSEDDQKLLDYFNSLEKEEGEEYTRKAEKVCDFCHEEQGTMYKTKTGKDICEYCKGEESYAKETDVFTWISQKLGLKPRKQTIYGPKDTDNRPKEKPNLCSPSEIYDYKSGKCIPKYMAPWKLRNQVIESHTKENFKDVDEWWDSGSITLRQGLLMKFGYSETNEFYEDYKFNELPDTLQDAISSDYYPDSYGESHDQEDNWSTGDDMDDAGFDPDYSYSDSIDWDITTNSPKKKSKELNSGRFEVVDFRTDELMNRFESLDLAKSIAKKFPEQMKIVDTRDNKTVWVGESYAKEASNPKMSNLGRIEDIYREMERIVDPDMTGDVNRGYSDQMIRDMAQKHSLSEYQIQEIWDSGGTTDIDVSNEEYTSENEKDFDLSDWNPKTLKDKIFGPSILPGADWVTKKITGEELTDDEFEKFRLKQPRHDDDEYAMDQVCTKCGLEKYEHDNNKLGHDFAMRGNEEIIEKKPFKPTYLYYKQYPLGRRANVKSHYGNEQVPLKTLRKTEIWWEKVRVKQGYPRWKEMNIINRQRAITDYLHNAPESYSKRANEINKKRWENASMDERETELAKIGFGMSARDEGTTNSLAMRSWKDLPRETRSMWGHYESYAKAQEKSEKGKCRECGVVGFHDISEYGTHIDFKCRNCGHVTSPYKDSPNYEPKINESYAVSNERFGDFFEFDEGESGERFEGHRYECKICGKVFDEDDDRFGHLKNFHNKSAKESSRGESAVDDYLNLNGLDYYDLGDRMFYDEALKHIKQYYPNIPEAEAKASIEERVKGRLVTRRESYSAITKMLNEADFKEDEHPREDDGQFTDKGGGSSGGDKKEDKKPIEKKEKRVKGVTQYTDEEAKRLGKMWKAHPTDKMWKSVKGHMLQHEYGGKIIVGGRVNVANNKWSNEMDKLGKLTREKDDWRKFKNPDKARAITTKIREHETKAFEELQNINSKRNIVKDGHWVIHGTHLELEKARPEYPKASTHGGYGDSEFKPEDFRVSGGFGKPHQGEMVKVGDTVRVEEDVPGTGRVSHGSYYDDKGTVDYVVTSFSYGDDEHDGVRANGYVVGHSGLPVEDSWQLGAEKDSGNADISDIRRIVKDGGIKMKKSKESYAKEFESPLRDQYGQSLPFPDVPEGEKTKCTFCGAEFDSWDEKADHITMEHNPHSKNPEFWESYSKERSWDTKPWECSHDDIDDKSGRGDYECKICGASMRTMNTYSDIKEDAINNNLKKFEDYSKWDYGVEKEGYDSIKNQYATEAKTKKSFSDMTEKELEELGEDESNPQKGLEAKDDECVDCGRKRSNHWKGSSGVLIDHDFKPKAEEGGRGSGKRGHAGWMRSLEEASDYKECPNCKVMTEQYGGKCQLCGKNVVTENKANEGTYEAEVYCEKCNTIVDKFDYKDTGDGYDTDRDREVWRRLGEHNKKVHPKANEYHDPYVDDIMDWLDDKEEELVKKMTRGSDMSEASARNQIYWGSKIDEIRQDLGYTNSGDRENDPFYVSDDEIKDAMRNWGALEV